MTTFVMLTHATRTAARARSLASVQAAAPNVNIRLIISSYQGSGADAEVRARAYEALSAAAGGSLVFLEDDILVNPHLFARHLALAQAERVVVAFCAVNERHYQPGIMRQAALPVTLAPIPEYDADRGFHGSMALYLPPAMVRYGVAHPQEFRQANGTPLTAPVIEPDRKRGKVTGFDFWVKHTARRFGGMLVALPNSVDHDDRGGVHGAGGMPRRSPTFNIPPSA